MTRHPLGPANMRGVDPAELLAAELIASENCAWWNLGESSVTTAAELAGLKTAIDGWSPN